MSSVSFTWSTLDQKVPLFASALTSLTKNKTLKGFSYNFLSHLSLFLWLIGPPLQLQVCCRPQSREDQQARQDIAVGIKPNTRCILQKQSPRSVHLKRQLKHLHSKLAGGGGGCVGGGWVGPRVGCASADLHVFFMTGEARLALIAPGHCRWVSVVGRKSFSSRSVLSD